MKKSFSFLLVIIFLFNTMGYWFVFKVNQSVIQSVMRGIINSGFHKEMYVLIKIDHPESNPDFKMLDHDEFTYCGRLYDIVSESSHGTTTWYYCINDKKEQRLIAGFEKIQTYTSDRGYPGKIKHTLALLHNLIILALVNHSLDLVKPDPSEITLCQYSDHTITTIQIPLSPPPELS
jgi:hypothetical protein